MLAWIEKTQVLLQILNLSDFIIQKATCEVNPRWLFDLSTDCCIPVVCIEGWL